jgi:hypothetical protein
VSAELGEQILEAVAELVTNSGRSVRALDDFAVEFPAQSRVVFELDQADGPGHPDQQRRRVLLAQDRATATITVSGEALRKRSASTTVWSRRSTPPAMLVRWRIAVRLLSSLLDRRSSRWTAPTPSLLSQRIG